MRYKNVFFPMKTISNDEQPLIVSTVDIFLFDPFFPNLKLPPKNALKKLGTFNWSRICSCHFLQRMPNFWRGILKIWTVVK